MINHCVKKDGKSYFVIRPDHVEWGDSDFESSSSDPLSFKNIASTYNILRDLKGKDNIIVVLITRFSWENIFKDIQYEATNDYKIKRASLIFNFTDLFIEKDKKDVYDVNRTFEGNVSPLYKIPLLYEENHDFLIKFAR